MQAMEDLAMKTARRVCTFRSAWKIFAALFLLALVLTSTTNLAQGPPPQVPTKTLPGAGGIVDNSGYIPFDQDAANLFFQLIASRYEVGSVMVTSNLPFGRWGETFSDDVVAAAMIDRLVHHAEVLTLTGDSYRTRARRELLTKQNRSNQD